jgi:hypothetical protein
MPGGLHNLIHSDTPTFANAQSTYQFPCFSVDNPRADYCDEVLATSEITEEKRFSMFPNPALSELSIESDKAISHIELFNQLGELLISTHSKNIPVASFPRGLYFVKVSYKDNSIRVEKLIKE